MCLVASSAVVLADVQPIAFFAAASCSSCAVVLTDARPAALIAPPYVVVLTEARPPALLARAAWRLCLLMLDPSHCLHLLLMRLRSQMPDPPHTLFLAAAHHLNLSPDDPYPVLLSRRIASFAIPPHIPVPHLKV